MEESAVVPPWDTAGLIQHFRFVATMQLRTPLHILLRHNDTHWDRSSPPPRLVTAAWQGIWIPCTRLSGLFDHGATMASEIGQIPASGGDFLRFLLLVRGAAEGAATKKYAAALEIATRAEWAEIADKLGGPKALTMRLTKAKAG